MGQEAQCTVRSGNKVSSGKALLESSELIFRGDFRLAIPFREIKSVKASAGALRVKFRAGAASFELGPLAEKWAEKILHPPSLLDKLGVKPAMKISLVQIGDPEFLRQLAGREPNLSRGKPGRHSDLIFYGAERVADLVRLRDLVPCMKSSGAIWVIYPKGRKEITEANVMRAGKASGLVDIKVASFSPTHTALKLVIPRARR